MYNVLWKGSLTHHLSLVLSGVPKTVIHLTYLSLFVVRKNNGLCQDRIWGVCCVTVPQGEPHAEWMMCCLFHLASIWNRVLACLEPCICPHRSPVEFSQRYNGKLSPWCRMCWVPSMCTILGESLSCWDTAWPLRLAWTTPLEVKT